MSTPVEGSQQINLNEVRKAHAIVHQPGQQVEVRALLKDGGAMSGRFDDEAKMLEWLKSADDPSVAVAWWSIQPLVREPATNDLQRRKGSANDSVVARRWILVDVDPVRETDPASDEEVYLASVKTNEVLDWLLSKGIEFRLALMSGNGYHLYIAADDWPNDEEHNKLAKAFIGMLSAKFSDANVKIDSATANPGRLGKVPGCISRKGTEDEDRAYRMVEIEFARPEAPALTAHAMKNLIEGEGYSVHAAPAPRKSAGLDPDFDIYDFAEWCGVSVEGDFEKNGCTFYALDECPMAGHRHRGTLGKTCFIVGDSLGFECFSDDCEGMGIRDVLRKFREENGPYENPLFLELDLSDRFPIDDIDRIGANEPAGEATASAPAPIEATQEKDTPEPAQVEGDIHLTDLGNSKRLVKACGNDIRYCFHTKKWYVWTARRWATDDKGTIYKKAKRVVQSILVEAAGIEDDEIRKSYIKHERASESDNRIKAMVSLAQSEGDIPVRLSDFDRDTMLLNTVSGTIDLSTGKVGPHRRSDLATKMSPVAYDPEAKCPTWERFLNQVTAGNKPLQDYLQRCVGYSLTGETKEHALFLLYGKGANGKSTLLEVVRHVLGDYAQTADFASSMVSKNETIRNDIAKLNGARLVTATESESGKRMSEAVVKQLTGGDTVSARFLYSEHFEFVPQFKLWLARRDISVPIGVALWSHDAPWVQVRFVSPHEKVSRVSKTSDFPYINLVSKRVKNWIHGEPLPYSEGKESPNSDTWWRHLQKVLVHKVRVSEPRSIDSQNPERDIEVLYKEIVGGAPVESNERVDHLISKCLGGDLVHRLHRGELTGFAGKPVRVMRFYSGPVSTVVVEGVNLTTDRAADDTDELVGRLQRAAADSTVENDEKQKSLITIVGYLATEHGLNGEAYLKEWIEKKTKARAFDIQRETEGFREATQAALAGAGTAS